MVGALARSIAATTFLPVTVVKTRYEVCVCVHTCVCVCVCSVHMCVCVFNCSCTLVMLLFHIKDILERHADHYKYYYGFLESDRVITLHCMGASRVKQLLCPFIRPPVSLSVVWDMMSGLSWNNTTTFTDMHCCLCIR